MSLGRFVHTSDLHLGSPFSGIESTAPHVARALRDATYETLHTIVQLCLDQQVDGLLIAGDVFEVRSLTSQLQLQSALKKLADAGIRSFICHGNHDPLDTWEARLDLPAAVHRFGSVPESVPLDPARPDGVVITGASFETRDVRQNLAATFVRPPSQFAVGLLHANVSFIQGPDAYAACRIEDLAGLGYGYWALGHIHERKVFERGGVTISYSGAPQGLNRKQGGVRGVNLVTITDDGRVELEFHETAAIRWESVKLAIDQLDSEQDLLDALRSEIDTRRLQCSNRRIVYDVALTGTTALHPSLHRAGFMGELRDTLNREYVGENDWAWCATMSVDTKAPLDRQQRMGGRDFIAALLRMVEGAQHDPEALRTLVAGCDELLDDPQFQNLLVRPSDEEWQQMLRDAETECLNGLEAENLQ